MTPSRQKIGKIATLARPAPLNPTGNTEREKHERNHGEHRRLPGLAALETENPPVVIT